MPCTIADGGPAVSLNPAHASFLLSRAELFTQLDRQRSKWIPLDSLDTNADYLIVKLVDKVRRLYITEASAVNLFPVLEVVRFNAPTLQRLTLTGNDDAAQLENDIIIGPDT